MPEYYPSRAPLAKACQLRIAEICIAAVAQVEANSFMLKGELVRPERLLGAARLVPSGPPSPRAGVQLARTVKLSNSACCPSGVRINASSGRHRPTVLNSQNDGAPGEIRTPDLLVRSQALYPTELRARIEQIISNTWRRGRDSNPRWAFDPYALSRGAPSTTRPPLPSGY
jgi:hypothetical protein